MTLQSTVCPNRGDGLFFCTVALLGQEERREADAAAEAAEAGNGK